MCFTYQVKNKDSVISSIDIQDNVITIYYNPMINSPLKNLNFEKDKHGMLYKYVIDSDLEHNNLHKFNKTEQSIFHCHIMHQKFVTFEDLKYLVNVNFAFNEIIVPNENDRKSLVYLEEDDKLSLFNEFQNYQDNVKKSTLKLILDRATSYNSTGVSYFHSQNFISAAQQFNLAISIIEPYKQLIEFKSLLSFVYYNLGSTHYEYGNYKNSKEYFEQCYNIRKTIYDESHALCKKPLLKLKMIEEKNTNEFNFSNEKQKVSFRMS